MKAFEGVSFLGTFRNYQQRVLDRSSQYLKNKKIHIVAAPGSGKTILGLELIRRINSPCLVLSPTNTIKFQWGERFEEMYLPKGAHIDDYVSFNLKNVKPITSITYQALHSAINNVVCKDEDGEIIDYTGIDILSTLKIHDIKTICVDEAHHLQNEWQKALEKFIKSLSPDINIIALTATPPYDATPTEWNRYVDICGEIDEEIFVTELVKAKNLCPHQDYVYLNYPTLEENEYFKAHMDRVKKCITDLKTFSPLIKLGETLISTRAKSYVLQEKELFTSILGLLKFLNINFDEKNATNTLQIKNIFSSLSIAEKGLNNLLENEYILSSEIKEELKAILKKHKLLERNSAKLILNSKLEKTITYSLGKLESISNIVDCELKTMGDNLRMLVLTDFIRKKDQNKIGTNALFQDISVVSIFETIRRRFPDKKIGLLSGTLAILPTNLEGKVKQLLANKKSALSLKELNDTGYSEYVFNLNNKDKVRIVGQLFESGLINILVGTKSLLGEGWDSPCINSLILASFVGSFMLSNQMRGRAIRVYKKDPNKTANIWHLVTLNPEYKNDNILMTEETSNDYKTLKRRFECFVGPHYERKSIQNGIHRISILKEHMTYQDIQNINLEMQKRSSNRQEMAKKWFENKSKSDQMYMETLIPKERVTASLGLLSIPNTLLFALLLVASIQLTKTCNIPILHTVLCIISVIFSIITAVYLIKLLILSVRRLFVKYIAFAIMKSMSLYDLIKKKNRLRVKYNIRTKTYDVLLINSSIKDQQKFSKALMDFFTYSSSARYIVLKTFYSIPLYRYSFVVPKDLAKNKHSTYIFAWFILFLKSFKMVYLRNNRSVGFKCSTYNYLNFNCRPITKRQNNI